MAQEGNNKWVIYLVGVLVTLILFIALPTMAKAIWENDRTNNKDHTEIRHHINKFSIEQMRQGTILERIDNKL